MVSEITCVDVLGWIVLNTPGGNIGHVVLQAHYGITVMACPGDDACKTVKRYEKSMPSGKESIFQIITGH